MFVLESMFMLFLVLPLRRFSSGTLMHLMLSVMYPRILTSSLAIARYVLERSLTSMSMAFSLRNASVAESCTDLNVPRTSDVHSVP